VSLPAAREALRPEEPFPPAAREAVKYSLDQQKHFTPGPKVVEGAKKQSNSSLRGFAPWRFFVRLFIFS
jgi:hypothetical protein